MNSFVSSSPGDTVLVRKASNDSGVLAPSSIPFNTARYAKSSAGTALEMCSNRRRHSSSLSFLAFLTPSTSRTGLLSRASCQPTLVSLMRNSLCLVLLMSFRPISRPDSCPWLLVQATNWLAKRSRLLSPPSPDFGKAVARASSRITPLIPSSSER